MSGIVNKVKAALHTDKNTTGSTPHGTTTTSGTAEGVAGPHSSRAANAADPRVDSDLDGSRNVGSTGTTHGTTGSGLTGSSHGTSGIGNSSNYSSTTAGPHGSNLANKADPRVDSDRDGSSGLGTTGTHPHTGSTTTPHNNNLLNKADPRVESTTSGTYGGTHAGNSGLSGTTGTTGGISHSTNAGPHASNTANKADPRVDSDLDNRGNRHGASTGGILGTSGSHATAGSGTAQNTAGPHNSDTANKLDPRVDSDRDGSKTYGGNKTHA